MHQLLFVFLSLDGLGLHGLLQLRQLAVELAKYTLLDLLSECPLVFDVSEQLRGLDFYELFVLRQHFRVVSMILRSFFCHFIDAQTDFVTQGSLASFELPIVSADCLP